ncbi:cbb3-type cytochrome c oxidase subunit II [Thioclava atlantica]|uniref:Cytochrome C oxidase, mono-heme subunit n=1 Tax=Thioclava atlantica TaxID=1317124 RepID=A0A085TV36_9RHOB|nr:cbb3-type cytochrome c oxidase subunit II [Thioclava atlantica]KFE34583.1 cytochrome C oxidase, mono-heme subunit [Thioclava atlantica]
MNRYLPLAITTLAILAIATLFLVIAPGMQIRGQGAAPGLQPYTEAEARGREVYISMGCVYCHSQQPRATAQAPDAERGWGRASVAGDYAYDAPHLLGTMRSGPDLMDIGDRLPSQGWQLTHLYQPRAISSWSIMPAYPFLFEHKDKAAQGDVVVKLPPAYAPETGVIVANQEALDLVAYLRGMRHDYAPPADGLRDDGYALMAAQAKSKTEAAKSAQ